MTIDSSAPGIPDQFDTGPLSWIMEELRSTLGQTLELVKRYGEAGAALSATDWRQAAASLHQAHGALQIVDVAGASLITEAAEDLLQRFAEGSLLPDAGMAASIVAACEALIEYLEELLTTAQSQPLLLYPYYRALQAARGAARIHPSELYFPNLSILPQLPAAPGDAVPADASVLRQRFEKALLSFLKSAEPAAERAASASMAEVLEGQRHLSTTPQQAAFWWVLQGFASGVASGSIATTVEVKQLFGRINLLMRKPAELPAETRDRLLRDALFFIASADEAELLLQRIREVYRLEPLRISELNIPRYGHADAAALSVARGYLANAKSSWDKLAGGDQAAAAAFSRHILDLSAAGRGLKGGVLHSLLAELMAIAHQVQKQMPTDKLALETAAGLLFIENAMRRSRIDDEFSARVEAMAARLHAVAAGAEPDVTVDWLDSMSEREQQRQSMATLVNEIRSNLAQTEKMLDEFFGNCAKRTVLAPVDNTLYQVEGALSILDLEDAASAVRYVRTQVAAFASPNFEGEPGHPEFQQVARNIGALSLFIDGLQSDSPNARDRFVFDPVSGLFQARAETSQPVAVAVAPWTREESPQVLVEESAQDAEGLLDGASAVSPESQQGSEPPGLPSAAAVESQPDSEPAVSSAPAHEQDPVDAELLDIFLSEALELLESVDHTLPLLTAHPNDQEYLTTTRRCFHTLKGSSRMVGLNAFGEAAWGIEKTLNVFLADGAAASADLLQLLQRARIELGAWVDELREHGASARSADALSAAAERVRAGEPIEDQAALVAPEAVSAITPPNEPVSEVSKAREEIAMEVEADASGNDPTPVVEDFAFDLSLLNESEHAAAQDEVTQEFIQEIPQEALPILDFESESLDVEASVPAPDAQAEFALSIPASADEGQGEVPGETLESIPLPEKVIELESIPEDFIDHASLEEAIELSPMPAEQPEHECEIAPSEKPEAQIIRFPDAQPLEDKIDDSIKRIGDIEISVPLHNIYLAETDELLRLLSQDLSEWRHEAHRNVNTATVHAAHSLAGSSATVGFAPLHELAYALEKLLQSLARKPVPLLPEEFDALDAVLEQCRVMVQCFALGEMPPPAPEQVGLLQALRADLMSRAETAVREVHSTAPVHVTETPVVDDASAEEPLGAQERPLAGFAPVDASHAELPPLRADDAARMPRDELDPDLLPVFLEEANDILPQIQTALRAWQANPADLENAHALQRLLHTIKGSARMAGAMRFGQHMHELESRIEQITLAGAPGAAAIDDLLGRFDLGLYLFDNLRNPDAVRVAPPAADAETVEATQASPAIRAPVSAPLPNAPLVRVRADVLDRLVNQAGEVSISRSRAESEIAGMRQALSELTDNVERLRGQLREMEIQAESQMASQMAQSAERGFDPLEFDRFTRLQELTRMMAETVNDVVSVQQGLARSLDSSSDNLQQQARLTRDLQQDLMRVRMVQFASIAERLYRVTRQAAKETDKRVNLDIHGGAVEVDRGVLEKMAGPFEHVLRNAVVHGIELREERVAAGKREVGELLIEIRQEGNEVVIRFSDDGRGLDLARILEKARQAGLVRDGAQLNEAEIRELIFHPGFSTATEVTELAGRGIGMDVVRSEAAALGGRVDIESEAGKGSCFVVRLPLTLAVTQVVVLSTGGNTYAVPSVLVEQVQQLKANALASAYAEGALVWQQQKAPLHFLSELLGDSHAAPLSQQYSPVLILRRGDERVAIHVDEVLGNREVVVKNIGPQLARMAGVAGATVLGSGDIVLIIDPIPLAQRAAGRQHQMHAEAAVSEAAPASASSAPRSQPIVMVVDDSLTVRRVTQRFLTREGYQVVLAKDGVDALEQLQSVTPDVMLVDIEMPRMDGFDLTRNVRGDSRTRHIPIIMITSRTASKHRNLAMELGVNEYLGKPYQDEDLLRLVNGFVSGASPVV